MIHYSYIPIYSYIYITKIIMYITATATAIIYYIIITHTHTQRSINQSIITDINSNQQSNIKQHESSTRGTYHVSHDDMLWTGADYSEIDMIEMGPGKGVRVSKSKKRVAGRWTADRNANKRHVLSVSVHYKRREEEEEGHTHKLDSALLHHHITSHSTRPALGPEKIESYLGAVCGLGAYWCASRCSC